MKAVSAEQAPRLKQKQDREADALDHDTYIQCMWSAKNIKGTKKSTQLTDNKGVRNKIISCCSGTGRLQQEGKKKQ